MGKSKKTKSISKLKNMKKKPILLLLCLFFFIVLKSQVSKIINVSTPGTLSIQLTTVEKNTVTDLTVIGLLNGSDYSFLKDNLPAMTSLDIRDVTSNDFEMTTYFGPYSQIYYYTANSVPLLKPTLISVVLPRKAKTIGFAAFYGSTITSIIIPQSVTEIGRDAFQGCEQLKSVIIDNSPVDIYDGAFNGCTTLKNVNFGNSLKSLGTFAFSNDYELDNITLPPSLTKIDDKVFLGCSGLKKVTILSSSIGAYMFSECTSLSEITMTNLLSSIGEYAFNNCSAITDFKTPSSVKSIETSAFFNCTGLKKINLPAQLATLECGILGNCTSLDTLINESSNPITNSYDCQVFYQDDVTKCVLKVPYKSASRYAASTQWSNFGKIIENNIGAYLDVNKFYISEKSGDTLSFKIQSNDSWSVSCNNNWVEVTPKQGRGDGNIRISVSGNDSISSKKAVITVFDSNNTPQQISLIQHGKQILYSCVPGRLSSIIQESDKVIADNIKITGNMDARDFYYLRENLPQLTSLDLNDILIYSYSGSDGTNYYSFTNYPENELPVYSFSSKLLSLKLPARFNGVNKQGLACAGLKDLYVNQQYPPFFTLAYQDVFKYIDTLKCNLHVPYNTLSLYRKANQWKNFRNTKENPFQLAVGSDTLTINSRTGNTIKLKVNTNINWNFKSNQSWLVVKAVTGNNADSLTFIAESNNDFHSRLAMVVLYSQQLDSVYVVVKQEGKEVGVNLTAGTLKNEILPFDKANLINLRITGTMDARDFKTLRDSFPNLANLDLSSVNIVQYSGVDGTNEDSYTNYVYPANEIPVYAFFDHNNWVAKKSINTILLPNSATSIGSNSFYNCEGLKEITFTSNVSTIKDFAFEECVGLKTIILPDNIKTLGEGVFSHCTNINSVTLPKSLVSTGVETFQNCTNLTQVFIPESINKIGTSCFESCVNLKSIQLPQSLTTIEPSAFSHCSGLSAIEIPESVYSIGASAFYECTGINKITIPNSVKNLSNNLFTNCTNLTNVQLSESLVSIGISCFEKCSKLTDIYLPQSLKSIGGSAFSYSGIKAIELPDSVTAIQPSTFGGCYSLRSVKLPKTLTSIGYFAFNDCEYLPTITIPNSVTFIGTCAFQGCEYLNSIICKTTLPVLFKPDAYVFNNVNKTNCTLYVNYKTKTSYQAAIEWKDFKNIVEDTQGVFIESDNVSLAAEGGTPKALNVVSNVSWEIKNNFNWISASKGTNNGQEYVVITASDNSAVVERQCYIELIGSNGESYKISIIQDAELKIVNCSAGTLSSALTVSEKRQLLYLKITGTIDARDFKVIRDSLINLEKLDISEAIISQISGFVELDPDRWGYGYTYYAATIPANSFYSKSKLTSVLLPNSITKIEKNAFVNCDNLKAIIIPDHVTAIDYEAFYACDSLKNVLLGKSVVSIGSSCFEFCYALNKIVVTNPVPVRLSTSNYAFYGVDVTKCYLVVPSGSLNAFKIATVWKEFLNLSEITTSLPSMNQSNIRVITGRGKLGILHAEIGCTAQIYTISGIKIKEQTVVSDQTDMFLPTGVYVLRIGNFANKILIK